MQYNYEILNSKQAYVKAFCDALECVSTKRPPAKVVRDWLEEKNENLQTWCNCHYKFEWQSGIGTIEAITTMLDTCVENPNNIDSSAFRSRRNKRDDD